MSSPAPTPKKILIFGATGVIGKYITQALIDRRSDFERIGIFTSQSTAENKKEEIERLKSNGVEVLVGDAKSEEDVSKAYDGKCMKWPLSQAVAAFCVCSDRVFS